MDERYCASSGPPEVRALATRLAQAHDCRVEVANERSGYHIYMPCPECLHTYKSRELRDPKFAINASKYLGIGVFRDQGVAGGFDPYAAQRAIDQAAADRRSGLCMRTRSARNPHLFSVSALLAMSPIHVRHPDILTRAEVVDGVGQQEREAFWEPDPVTGELCPPPPGEVVPITELPEEHPAVDYLVKRGFDLQRLYDQFRCGFCVREYPSSKDKMIFYRRMPGGWRDTPQGRVIFYALINEVPMTWQARMIERTGTDGLDQLALNPYTLQWDHVGSRASISQPWIPVPPFNEVDPDTRILAWQPSKYRTAKHSERQLMGWDAALKRAEESTEAFSWAVLCEGPLDAARVGPGGLAVLGASLSPDNAAKVASNFHLVITAFDTDRAGREATEKITGQLQNARARNPILQHVEPMPIPDGKDIGAMLQAPFDELLQATLRRAKRNL